MNIVVLLFSNFETLDVFGPVEIFGRMKDEFTIHYLSQIGGIIYSSQGVPILTEKIEAYKKLIDILFIPGGVGTRKEVQNEYFLNWILDFSYDAKYILTVCTGSGLAAKAGILDDKKATSNKKAFTWASSQSKKVNWIYKARWVRDENIYTSSGVSAGIDMTLGFISDILGQEIAMIQSQEIEYIWNEDPDIDPFADSSRREL